MYSFRRRIFLFVCLLVSAVAIAWSRSHRFAESVEIVTPGGGLLFTTHPGRLCACWPSPIAHPDARRWTVSAASAPFVFPDAAPMGRDADPYGVVEMTLDAESFRDARLESGV